MTCGLHLSTAENCLYEAGASVCCRSQASIQRRARRYSCPCDAFAAWGRSMRIERGVVAGRTGRVLGLMMAALLAATGVCVPRARAQVVIDVVARSGDAVPGMPGQTFFNFSAPYINNSGDLAISANLANSAGSFEGKRGAFLWSGGVLQKLIATGDAAPGGFPSPNYESAGVSRLDDAGIVVMQSTWPSSNPGRNGLHAYIPGQGNIVLQVPGATPHAQWPNLWMGNYNFLLSGGKFVDKYFQQDFGGVVGVPFQILTNPDTISSSGWPCPNMRLGPLYWNSMSNEGLVAIMSSVPCGYPAFGSLGSSVVGVLNALTGGVSERARACPLNAGNPPQQCGPTASRSINNYFTSLNGHESFERDRFDGQRMLIRDGVEAGSLTSWASDFLLPDETLHSVSGSALGEDGTLIVVFAARKTTPGGEILVGWFTVNPDGSTTLLGRQGQAIFGGGPVLTVGSSFSATSAQGITWLYFGNTIWSWQRSRGWKRVLGAGDSVRLGAGGVVGTLANYPSAIPNTYAGKERGMNSAGVLGVSLDVSVSGHSGHINAVATINLAAIACPGDFNGDGVVEDTDFVVFSAAYNTLDCADPSMPLGCAADLNADGFVDDNDFVIFVGAYNALICP